MVYFKVWFAYNEIISACQREFRVQSSASDPELLTLNPERVMDLLIINTVQSQIRSKR